MHNPILLLRLEGPLQSWGTRSRWDVRDSGDEPTKSGVIGLLGCALGLERGNPTLIELDQGLRFGVRVENAGRKVTDYQTITDFLPTAAGEWKGQGTRTRDPAAMRAARARPATIISPRDYLEDAAFLVGLEARDENGAALLERAARAVEAPHWPLFLGRKACVPTRPVFADFTADYENLSQALRHYDWDWLGTFDVEGDELRPKSRQKPSRRLSGWIETNDPNARGAVARQDVTQANKARVYGFRLAMPLDNIAPRNLNTGENSP